MAPRDANMEQTDAKTTSCGDEAGSHRHPLKACACADAPRREKMPKCYQETQKMEPLDAKMVPHKHVGAEVYKINRVAMTPGCHKVILSLFVIFPFQWFRCHFGARVGGA